MTRLAGGDSWLDVGWFVFWMRLVGWLFTLPLFALWRTDGAAAVLVAWLVISLIVQILGNCVFWISLRPAAIVIQLLYLGAAAWQWMIHGVFDSLTWLATLTLVFLLGSDVVARKQRAWTLVLITPAAFALAALPGNLNSALVLFLCATAPIAALSRATWPASSEGVMQTSLDYGPCRLEIISYGMKKALAIGLRRNDVPSA